MDRHILVIKRESLFNNKEFQGFCPINLNDFTETILKNSEYQHRDDKLENNPSLQQIIPYVWIVNPKTKSIFFYKRSTEGEEGRLHNKYSGGVGGHIDRITEEKSENPIIDAMMRELKEELTMQNYPTPKFVGFLNDDSEPVGKVHFGIVALAETEENAQPAQHMSHGQFYTIEEAEILLSNPKNELESWSKLSWPFVKNYLENHN